MSPSNPVDTRRRFSVDATLCDIVRRRIDVETTSCVYGELLWITAKHFSHMSFSYLSADDSVFLIYLFFVAQLVFRDI